MSIFNRFIPSLHTALAMFASITLLSACGGGSSGDVGPDVLPDSITISSLDGPSGVTAGTSTSFTVKVVTSGGIGSGEITYTWEQTSGTAVVAKSQTNADYQSTLTFTPIVAGETVTFKVTASARGKTASQSKSVPVNP
jgi:hypothetical protein